VQSIQPRALADQLKVISVYFHKIPFLHVYREQNRDADALSKGRTSFNFRQRVLSLLRKIEMVIQFHLCIISE
jgi:hypothetical protein